MANVATATMPKLPDVLIPQPEATNLQAKLDKVPDDHPFDPVALKQKYLAERDKRLHNNAGVDQYIAVEGSLSHYIEDPFLDKKIEREPVDEECEALIVGGGYGGQLVAVRLIEAGIKNIWIIEKGGEFGGTWYWNRYPGAQCDIESYVYMPLLDETGYVPTEKYARAEELLNLHWDEQSARWVAKTNRGDNIRATFAILAAGPLHRPKLPGLSGISSFKGHSFHSSRWDYNYTGGDPSGGLNKFMDKRVGIIGTGATAVQIVPHLGEWAKQVCVFQRTPSSVDVRGNKATDPNWVKTLGDRWQKKRMDNFNIIVNGGHQDEDLVSDGWTDILRELLARPKPGENVDPEAMAAKRQLADFKKMESVRARVDAIVKDRETAESLKPYYNQFCKRPCFHDEYLDTFNRPNVKLVDTRGRGVNAITEKGVLANGEEFELDCLIYATGFELATDWSHRADMEVHGRDGLTITEKWKDGASTLHGWTSRGFPNCFFVSIVQAALTPNFIHITGEQASHIVYVISTAKARNIRTLEPTEKAEQEWVDTILELGKLRQDYNKECTPGYYNNEGKPSPVAARNASYGTGALAFIKILDDWRDADTFEGLEITEFPKEG